MRVALQHGLEPGEHILVKAPFQTTDGSDEWMWVDVATWDETAIRGTLQNEPSGVPGLRAGQIVEVDPERVFDYIHSHADGELEGNETGRILEGRRPSSSEP